MSFFTNGSVLEENDSFIFPKELEIGTDDISEFINYHKQFLVNKYQKKLNDYKGIVPKYHDDPKALLNKNHLIIDMPKYLVDTLNGFFVGIAPTIKLDDKNANKSLQDWLNDNSFVDDLNELAKQSSIYGRSYVLCYQDEDSNTNIAVVRPTNGFMIYDDSIKHKPLAFIRYGHDKEKNIVGTIYFGNKYQEFKDDGNVSIIDEQQLVYQGHVPAVEFFDNSERTAVTDGVSTLIDELNKLLSQKADDIDYFADAYLAILGAELPTDEIGNIKQSRVINLYGGDSDKIDIKFLEKPNADETQEHAIDRVTNLIFQISMVANINDEVFGNATSGRSLEYKLLSMRNLTSNKERKFTKQLRALFSIIGSINNFGNVDLSKDIQFQFVRNLPNNNAEEAQTASTINGLVSDETMLSTLSIVKDPDEEIKKIASENKDKANQAKDNAGLKYDYQIDENIPNNKTDNQGK